MTVQLWIKNDLRIPSDDFGRGRSRSGRKFLREVADQASCISDVDKSCGIVETEDHRSWCTHCGSGWSVSHMQGLMIVGRAAGPVGVDIETRRRRLAAFRWLSRQTGVEIDCIEQWTQAEALWKAMGNASRRPNPAELPLNGRWDYGWQVSSDRNWQIYTAVHEDSIWSVASTTRGEVQLEII